MKRIIKITSILILLVICMSNFVMATDPKKWDGASAAQSMVTASVTKEEDGGVTESASNIVKAIITIVRTIATGVAVIMLIVVAMKYMMSAPGDRADIKKHAVVYVVGAVVLFATSGILGILVKFAGTIKVS